MSLSIVITGAVASGKTTAALVIRKALEEAGVKTVIMCDPDISPGQRVPNHDKPLGDMTEAVQISTVQLPRGF